MSRLSDWLQVWLATPPTDDSPARTVPVATSPASPATLVTADLLRATRTEGVSDAAGWAPVVAAACNASGIITPQRTAAFLANILHETGGLAVLVESLNYSVPGLETTFGASGRITREQAAKLGRTTTRAADQEAIANIVYGGAWGERNLGNTQPGDGWLFRGRGLLQLTGRANYQRFANVLGVPLVSLPTLLETRDGAAQSAAQFWQKSGCNAIADTGDVATVRRKINGGALGLSDVQLLYGRALAAMGQGAMV